MCNRLLSPQGRGGPEAPGSRAQSKEDAIRQAGELLVRAGCVAPGHVDAQPEIAARLGPGGVWTAAAEAALLDRYWAAP